MHRRISLLLVLIITFCISNVNAQTYQDKINEHGMWIPNEFVSKRKNGSTKYQQMTLIERVSDGRYLYCIEPGKSIDENSTFIGYDDNQKFYVNLTEEDWEKINLIAYYGYGYSNHTDIKWYVITQFMIWQVNPLGYDIYFTDSLNGNRIDKYQEEMNEIQLLVDDHLKKPDFSTNTLNLFIDSPITFFDRNRVLNKYEIDAPSIVEMDHDNGTLILKSTQISDGIISFKKRRTRFGNNPIVYIDSTSQNLLLPGNLPEVICNYNYITNYGKLTVNKHDRDNNYNEKVTLENALYGIYDLNNNLIEQKYTNKNGKIVFDTKLKAGSYYVKEITPSRGYTLDNNRYDFTIQPFSYNHSFDVYEQIIKEEFDITKYMNNNDNTVLIPEENIEFGIYDDNDILLNIYNTSALGKINFTLTYGDYVLKQHTTYPNYSKINNYNINVRNDGKLNKLVFINNPINEKDDEKEDKNEKTDKDEPINEEKKIIIDVKNNDIGAIENKEIEELVEEKNTNDDLIVEVPNTYKSASSNIIFILIFLIYTIKKLLLK